MSSEALAAGRAEVLAAFRKFDTLVDEETDTIEWRHFCRVLRLLDPAYYTDAVLTALGKQVAREEAAGPSGRFGLEALIGHIFGLDEAVAEPEASQEKVVVLHVRKFTGDILLSLHRDEVRSLSVMKLKIQASKQMGRRAPEVSLIMGTRKLEDAELIEELLPSEGGVLEVLVAVQQLPQFDPEQPSIGQLDALKWMLLSPDDDDRMAACRQFRQLLSIDRVPPIDQIIELGLVPRLVELCQERDNPALQFEAAWALTNVASGTTEQTAVVVQSRGVETFVELLQSPNDDVREQAVWGLGNIAGDSPAMRNRVLRDGALPLVVALWFTTEKLSFRRNAAWTVSNFCRGKPAPNLEDVLPATRMLLDSIRSDDEEVLADTAWALSYMCDGPNERIQAVLDCGVVHRLVELLQHPSATVQTPVLRTVGNIVTGDDVQTQQMVSCGVLPVLGGLLAHPKRGIRKECCWAISNVTAGTAEQIQAVMDAGLVGPLVEMLRAGEHDIQKEAAWAFRNATSGGSPEQISSIAHEDGCAMALVQAARSRGDGKLATCALGAIKNILEAGKQQQKKEKLSENLLVDVLYAAGLEGVAEAVQVDMEQVEEALGLADEILGLLAAASDQEEKDAERGSEAEAAEEDGGPQAAEAAGEDSRSASEPEATSEEQPQGAGGVPGGSAAEDGGGSPAPEALERAEATVPPVDAELEQKD